MKSLEDFFSDEVTSMKAISMNNVLGGHGSTRTECHEDTYSNQGCDDYVEITGDDGKRITSYTLKVECDPV